MDNWFMEERRYERSRWRGRRRGSKNTSAQPVLPLILSFLGVVPRIVPRRFISTIAIHRYSFLFFSYSASSLKLISTLALQRYSAI